MIDWSLVAAAIMIGCLGLMIVQAWQIRDAILRSQASLKGLVDQFGVTAHDMQNLLDDVRGLDARISRLERERR